MSGPRILITGCSGAGKSTLLAELARRGHAVVEEPGRRVIAAMRAGGGDGLPWDNPRRFAEACLAMAEQDWDDAGDRLTFFDRGVVDAVMALRRVGGPQDGQASLTGRRYDWVFLAPPWRALFEGDPDPDRRHSFTDAIAEYEEIAASMTAFGQVPVLLPEASVAARADWIETRLGIV